MGRSEGGWVPGVSVGAGDPFTPTLQKMMGATTAANGAIMVVGRTTPNYSILNLRSCCTRSRIQKLN